MSLLKQIYNDGLFGKKKKRRDDNDRILKQNFGFLVDYLDANKDLMGAVMDNSNPFYSITAESGKIEEYLTEQNFALGHRTTRYLNDLLETHGEKVRDAFRNKQEGEAAQEFKVAAVYKITQSVKRFIKEKRGLWKERLEMTRSINTVIEKALNTIKDYNIPRQYKRIS